MYSVKAAVLFALATLLLAAGCGGSSPSRAEKPRQAPGVPPGLPPAHARGAPPPAWAETQHDSHWLAYSSYCWGGGGQAHACADFVAPSCGDPRIPKIDLQQGETIRFHLGFEPTKVDVSGGGVSESLASSRDPIWRTRRANGTMTLSARTQSGSAAYAACLQFMRQTNGVNIHPND